MVEIEGFDNTVDLIYRSYEKEQKDDFRDHFGLSSAGHECDRYLWNSFRWAARQSHPGRILRLFDTGNLAEGRFVADLRRIGVQVMDVDPATGGQWQVRDATGHIGGSLDGLGLGFVEAPKTVHVIEMKTHNDKSFKELVKIGVEASKPLHFAQMQGYMHLGGWERAFYLAVNKNTDELHGERIKYNAEYGMRLVARSQSMVKMNVPPYKISNDGNFFKCKFCKFHSVCHSDTLPERHCRSCISSIPTEGGKWHCVRHNKALDSDLQRKGCYMHRYIPDLITEKGFEQTDAAEHGEWIEYKGINNGVAWRDQGI